MPLADTQRQAEEWENFVMKNKEGFRCALTGGCWPGEAASEANRSRSPLWLVGHRLEAGAKIKEVVNYVKMLGGPGAELPHSFWHSGNPLCS